MTDEENVALSEIDTIREWGGYLPFELDERYDEYFCRWRNNSDIVHLDCGRSAFYYALKCIAPKKVYVPYLNCKSSVDPIVSLNIPYEFYFLDENLMPKGFAPNKDDALLWINYYGNATKDMIKMVEEYTAKTNVIIDFCHAFFSKPVKNAWNCYSCRKFLGVCDGAYLIKEDIPKIKFKTSCSAERIGFILECIEKGTNACYPKNLSNEESLGHDCMEMSVLTKRILKTINYDKIKKIRRRNFIALHKRLSKINEFDVHVSSKTHMYYPLLVKNEKLRERLVNAKVYTPTWWRHVPDYFEPDSRNIETVYSKYMLMIPIDQRYTVSDMKDLSEIILQEYNAVCQ